MLSRFVLLTALLSSGVAFAAEKEDPNFKPNTLVGEGELHWGGFGSPVLKVTSLNERGAVMFGGRGAASVNHRLAFGGGGFGYSNDDFTFGYGGATVNFIFFPESLIHFDVGTMVAWGGTERGDVKSSVFVLEPEANVEMNIAKNVRLALGISYRHVMPRGGSAESDLSGLAGNLAVRFGSF